MADGTMASDTTFDPYCEMCDVHFNGPAPSKQHFTSRSHMKKLNVVNNIKANAEGYYCSVCKVSCDTYTILQNHNNTDKHIRLAAIHSQTSPTVDNLSTQNTCNDTDSLLSDSTYESSSYIDDDSQSLRDAVSLLGRNFLENLTKGPLVSHGVASPNLTSNGRRLNGGVIGEPISKSEHVSLGKRIDDEYLNSYGKLSLSGGDLTNRSVGPQSDPTGFVTANERNSASKEPDSNASSYLTLDECSISNSLYAFLLKSKQLDLENLLDEDSSELELDESKESLLDLFSAETKEGQITDTYCNVCKVSLTSWRMTREHLGGVRHKKQLDIWRVNQECSKRFGRQGDRKSVV